MIYYRNAHYYQAQTVPELAEIQKNGAVSRFSLVQWPDQVAPDRIDNDNINSIPVFGPNKN